MAGRYEFFDHTADVGVRAWAPTLPELVQAAGDGLYAVVGRLVAARETPGRWLNFEFVGDDDAVLLRDYLAELLRLLATKRCVVTAIAVEEFSPTRLRVDAETRALDLDRSSLEREVKAVTYHQLELRPAAGGYEATFIVDI